MCSNETSSPSTAHVRWYLMRPWSSSCSWLNRRVFSSVAGYILTGIVTSPKEMAPFHIVLGMVSPPDGFLYPAQAGRVIVLLGWGCPRIGRSHPRPVRTSPVAWRCHADAQEPWTCVHHRVPPAAARRTEGGALVDGGRRA